MCPGRPPIGSDSIRIDTEFVCVRTDPADRVVGILDRVQWGYFLLIGQPVLGCHSDHASFREVLRTAESP
jgi:hypothetical protein